MRCPSLWQLWLGNFVSSQKFFNLFQLFEDTASGLNAAMTPRLLWTRGKNNFEIKLEAKTSMNKNEACSSFVLTDDKQTRA